MGQIEDLRLKQEQLEQRVSKLEEASEAKNEALQETVADDEVTADSDASETGTKAAPPDDKTADSDASETSEPKPVTESEAKDESNNGWSSCH